jgi:hypothetical protein
MPGAFCHTYTTPDWKEAWDKLNQAETKLESLLLKQPQSTVAHIGGQSFFRGTYFIHKGKLFCTLGGTVHSKEDIRLENSINRMDYTDMDVHAMGVITEAVNGFLVDPVFH